MPPLLLSDASCCACCGCAGRGRRKGAGTCAPKSAAQASLQARCQAERGNTAGTCGGGVGLRRGGVRKVRQAG